MDRRTDRGDPVYPPAPKCDEKYWLQMDRRKGWMERGTDRGDPVYHPPSALKHGYNYILEANALKDFIPEPSFTSTPHKPLATFPYDHCQCVAQH